MGIAAALQETFWSAAAATAAAARTSHFLQLLHAPASAPASCEAVAPLFPHLQAVVARLRDTVAEVPPNDDSRLALAGVLECVGAFHGILAAPSSSPSPSSSPGHIDLQITTLQECVELKEALHGPQHFDTSRPLLSLAVALLCRAAAAADADDVSAHHSAENDSVEARSLLQRVIGLQETKFGSDHGEVRVCIRGAALLMQLSLSKCNTAMIVNDGDIYKAQTLFVLGVQEPYPSWSSVGSYKRFFGTEKLF